MFRQRKEQPARDLIAAAKEKMKPLPEEGEDRIKGIGHDQIITWLAYQEAAALINQ